MIRYFVIFVCQSNWNFDYFMVATQVARFIVQGSQVEIIYSSFIAMNHQMHSLFEKSLIFLHLIP
jgi:hypothetical protein